MWDLKKLLKMNNKTISVYDAQHPARQKAIKILESIAEYMGNEDIFDCKEIDCGGYESTNNDTTWYDLEDIVTNIIIKG